MHFDPQAFGHAMGEAIRKAVEPLKAEIADLRKQLEEMPAPVAIKGEDGRDGKDCDMTAVMAFVVESIKAIPLPKDGKDGKDGINGVDGKSVFLDDVLPALREHADNILKSLPAPKDGRDGKDGKDGLNGKDGERGEKGADGAGVADLLIDREGVLVATMTDGRMKQLGPVVGKDGRNGENGKDGADFTKASLDWDGERTLIVRGEGGEIKKTLPIPLDKGYWREGMACEKGDIVTHDGNAWIALKDNKSKPSHESKEDWRLFARKGKDGERGPKGSDGAPPAPIKLDKDK